MEVIGIVRKLDQLGRITLPAAMRKQFDLEFKTGVEIFVEGDSIILKKFKEKCLFCGSSEKVENYKGKNICEGCKNEMKQDELKVV